MVFQNWKKVYAGAMACVALALLLPAPRVLSAPAGTGSALNFTAPPRKKLLEYGWDVPNPTNLPAILTKRQDQPFDGIIFRLADGGGDVFDLSKWDEKKLHPQLRALSGLKWGRYTDNFLTLYAASTMDWTSESDWARVLSHVRFAARAARLAGCKGIMFDPEPYGNNPWEYKAQKHAAKLSYNDYQKIARRRGAQFMNAIQSEFPNPKILMLHGLTLLLHASSDVDAKKREAALQSHPYALMLGFTNGMLDAAQPNAQIIDGNEAPSYYYHDAPPYFTSYHEMRQTAKLMVAAENQEKYDRVGRASQALYADYIFNTAPDVFRDNPAMHMTSDQRRQWFEHNVYYALTATDEYAWLYSEKMNWWMPEGGTHLPALPAGLREAVVSARDKVNRGVPLSIDLPSLIRGAVAKRDAEIQQRLTRRDTTIAKIAIPTGIISTELAKMTALSSFMGYYDSTQENNAVPVKAPTQARLGYDDTNLYVAFTCAEPQMKDLRIIGEKRDDMVWDGDSVEVSIATQTGNEPLAPNAEYSHFIFNPRGVVWDARARGTANDLSWNSSTTATAKSGENEWVLLATIPWRDLGIVPQKGLKLRLNIARQRMAGETAEYSSWSQFVGGFQEPQNFGTVTLG